MSYSKPEAANACAYARPSSRMAAPLLILPRLKKSGLTRPDLRLNWPELSTSCCSAGLGKGGW